MFSYPSPISLLVHVCNLLASTPSIRQALTYRQGWSSGFGSLGEEPWYNLFL